MQMTFHLTPSDTVLFESWKVTDGWTMMGACALVVVAGVFVEAIKRYRKKINQDQMIREQLVYEPFSNRLFACNHIAQSLLFMIQLVFSYALMLIFMTFSVWLGIAVVAGLFIGYCTFEQSIR